MNMDSFPEPSHFIYNPNLDPESKNPFSGTLEILVHHARNIHNICIYEKQDVYTKFSLTYNPDETISTRIINGGGKNPDFNEHLIMKFNQPDAVLKCEIWMLSRAKNYMDDQLLGFALVPISSVFGKGKITDNFDLSSTDLFYSPAGTIKLSLSLSSTQPPAVAEISHRIVSTTSELLVKEKITEEYSRIEFPDINVVNENQQMVSEYFLNNGIPLKPWLETKLDGSFLQLGAGPLVEDYEMGGNSSEEENRPDLVSPNESNGFFSSTMTSLSDDRNSADSMDKAKKLESHEENEISFEGKDEEISKKVENTIKLEESAMQQQIVDMYMRSMQQFTESLAKMKLPMDLNSKTGGDDNKGNVKVEEPEEKIESEKKKKENSRVFYGSRAFF